MNKKRKKLLVMAFVVIGLYGAYIAGKRAIISDLILKKVYHSKVWVHRVNSIEKLQELAPEFSGVEVDIVYDSLTKTFDVNHPPAESIGLNLLEYLKANENKKTKFWLDFKNLTEENSKDALERLEYVVSESGYKKSNFIVESGVPTPLKYFHVNGFQTSYYLHWPGLFTLNDEELKKKIEEIQRNITKEIDFLSSPYNDYKIIKKYFPDKKMNIWVEVSKKRKRPIMDEHLYRLKLAQDPMVNVFLMQISTKAKHR